VLQPNLKVPKGRAPEVAGVDVDESSSGNPYIDVFHSMHPMEVQLIASASIDLFATTLFSRTSIIPSTSLLRL